MTIVIIVCYIIGIIIGWLLLSFFMMLKSSTHQDLEIIEVKVGYISENIRNMHKDFHNLVWRSYGIFIAALTLIGGWFASKLAFEPEIVKLIAPKSFISAILLAIVIVISLNMIWAAYISICLMVINKIIAEIDILFKKMLFHPLRLAYNSIFVLFIDLILFAICLFIILSYKELGVFNGKENIIWNIFYYVTIVIFGAGSYLRLRARLFVFGELSSI